MDVKRVKEIMAFLSVHRDALIECFTEEEDRRCREFLHTSGKWWCTGELYVGGGCWESDVVSIAYVVQEGCYEAKRRGVNFYYENSVYCSLIESAKAVDAYYQWSQIAEMLNSDFERSMPSDEELFGFLFTE